MEPTRDRIDSIHSIEFSISKNSIVDVRRDSADSINRLVANWRNVLKLNDQWTLFTDIDYIKTIDHGVSYLNRLSLSSAIAAIQSLLG